MWLISKAPRVENIVMHNFLMRILGLYDRKVKKKKFEQFVKALAKLKGFPLTIAAIPGSNILIS